MAITASEARKNLFSLIEQVNDDELVIEITSRRGNAMLVSSREWSAMKEFEYLMRSPANARELLESMRQSQAGEIEFHELDRS
ncbi:type II toxin-antitoxin system prevent-host-death family antitoxin [Subtercola sp. Z020]|uniref:type II toxin-antitoxin system Phd/YefM family antitoxin n=1 Tax=Subtercola sp. Z020 TaxID=2080582 RepID=UPI000CE74D3A|nr:type II toxin-antitoxin system prevent-host-death family antitoxin [Subtercola sp. Z020]PPF89706.1 type II toxin-antitoxin system prevent-host-death family antitoxin [Subtercola sp. Z020]